MEARNQPLPPKDASTEAGWVLHSVPGYFHPLFFSSCLVLSTMRYLHRILSFVSLCVHCGSLPPPPLLAFPPSSVFRLLSVQLWVGFGVLLHNPRIALQSCSCPSLPGAYIPSKQTIPDLHKSWTANIPSNEKARGHSMPSHQLFGLP